jgi:hypothetical protein
MVNAKDLFPFRAHLQRMTTLIGRRSFAGVDATLFVDVERHTNCPSSSISQLRMTVSKIMNDEDE